MICPNPKCKNRGWRPVGFITKPVKNMGSVERFDTFVRRKYVCLQCRTVFTTVEKHEDIIGQTCLEEVSIIKHDTRPEDRRALKRRATA